ncbi:MAG TPA: biotin/lipoyl-containing protein, partial [Steroidobacteraceae bacterium]|nr:biotin/lipoyl-containing protein [Steroidobacteraceae bacterium]
MTIEVRVPQLPESVADATLVAWHKKPGDSVVRDENLVDLETDKVVLEVPAPAAGVLKEIKLTDGTTVTSGQLLAVIEEGAAAAPGAAKSAAKDAAAAEAVAGKLSPAAKRVAEENKVDPKAVAGSGRDGRVSKSDVVNYLQAKDAAPTRAPNASVASNAAVAPSPAAAAPVTAAKAAPAQFVPAPSARGSRSEQHVPMTRLRARIAERMVQAQATQALLTSFNEVVLKAVNELRARYKDPFEKQYGVKLGFMSFFTKACVEA